MELIVKSLIWAQKGKLYIIYENVMQHMRQGYFPKFFQIDINC
jgi:hypothetical protein